DRDGWLATESSGQGGEDGKPLLAEGRDVAADGAEAVDGGQGAEAAGDLLADLHHAEVTLSLVVVERDAAIGHEGEGLGLMGREAEGEVAGRAALGASLLATGRWRGRVQPQALSDQVGIAGGPAHLGVWRQRGQAV